MKRAWVFAFLVCASPVWADDAADMKAAATAFYTLAIRQPGGIPDASNLIRYQPLVTASLSSALSSMAAAEGRWAARGKNAPPLLEGNIFVSLFEGATSFTVTACGPQSCSVDLVYDDKKSPATRWTDTAAVKKEAGAWRVDDVVYGGKWPFANSGDLRDTLKMATGLAR